MGLSGQLGFGYTCPSSIYVFVLDTPESKWKEIAFLRGRHAKLVCGFFRGRRGQTEKKRLSLRPLGIRCAGWAFHFSDEGEPCRD